MADNQDAIELRRRARRRLVGAIALVVFIVIALPIIFDREPKPITQDLTIQIPSQDSGKFSSRVLPTQPDRDTKAGPAPAGGSTAANVADSAAPAAPASAAKMDKAGKSETLAPGSKAATESVAPSGRAQASKGDAPKTAPKPDAPKAAPANASARAEPKAVARVEAVKPQQPAPAVSVPAAAPATAAAGAESFIVPLGLFRNPGNVQKVRGWVTSAGFKSFTEPVSESNGVKVMAGPFASREAAEKAREKLKGKGVDVGPVAAR